MMVGPENLVQTLLAPLARAQRLWLEVSYDFAKISKKLHEIENILTEELYKNACNLFILSPNIL